MKVFPNVTAILAAVGEELGTTEWLLIDQERINAFADATNDHQWIHVDAERAASGPFGGTIAHGHLTLSLLPFFTHQLLEVNGVAMGINYGFDRVRFLQPVRSGSRLRATAVIQSAESTATGVRVGIKVTVEIEGAEKPALIADSIALFVAAADA